MNCFSNRLLARSRSEERRVGKECRSRWSPHHKKKNEQDRVGSEREEELMQRTAQCHCGSLKVNVSGDLDRVYICHFKAFFFFQAEDGIRDATVTGVQTCALPI